MEKVIFKKSFNFYQNVTHNYRIKIVMIWFFHLNLLSTSKPCHIWCFTNLQIILVFAITYLTILFIQKLHFVLFCSLFEFCMWVLFYKVFSLPQALQLGATDSFIYYGCLSQFLMLMVDVLVNSFVFTKSQLQR